MSLRRKEGWIHWCQGTTPNATTHTSLKGKRKRRPSTTKPSRRHTQTPRASQLPHPGPMQDIFRTPAAVDIVTAIEFRSNLPHAGALQCLRQGEHISSSVIDDVITFLLRPLLPSDTATLLCTDSVLIPDSTNKRNHKRIANTINTHNITLLPLNASNHWFLAEINNVTKTITLHSFAGTCGQRTWVPTLQQWLITMIPGP